MSEHDTQPLTADQVPAFIIDEKIKKDLEQSILALQNKPMPLLLPMPHEHGLFTFLMNQNHNALRGCQSCGQTWVGLMAGDSGNLVWHPVSEPPEEEEE